LNYKKKCEIFLKCFCYVSKIVVNSKILIISVAPIRVIFQNSVTFVCLSFFRNHLNYVFLACTQLIISGKSVSQCASYSLIFSPLHSIINKEQHEKHLCNQSGHYRKYKMLNRQSACPAIDMKVGALL